MSTQRFTTRIEQGLGRFTIALLVGCLLVLPGWLPTAFASTRGMAEVKANANLPLDKAGVSIVRLIASYRENNSNTNNPTPKTFSCTGLGILVGSAAQAGGSGYVDWVLTSSSLVYSALASCESVDQQNGSVLSGITVYSSTEYRRTSATSNPETVPLGQLACQANGQTPACSDDEGNGKTGQAEPLNLLTSKQEKRAYTLFSFQTASPQPYLLFDNSAQGALLSTILGLTDGSKNTLPSAVVQSTQPTASLAYLTPNVTPPSSLETPTLSTGGPRIEDGTPVVDNNGALLGMYVNGGQTPQLLAISSMTMAQPGGKSLLPGPPGPNDLVTQWNAGMDALEGASPDKAKAHQAFQNVRHLNGSFGAAQFFDAQTGGTQPASPAQPGGVTKTPTTTSSGFSWALLIGLAAGMVALALLLVLVTLRIRRRRRGLAAFEADRLQADRNAEAEVQRQRAQVQQVSEADVRQRMQAPPQLLCPNCHHPVQLSDPACPNCRMPLSPSVSGSNVRLRTSPLPAPQPVAPPPPAYANSASSPSDMAMPINEQPTLHFPPGAAPVGMPGSDMAVTHDEKTLIGRKNGPRPDESLSYMPQEHAPILLLTVGTRSDPGIKRKHKPNEDSLFAMQGARTHNSEPQQFGLMVVADGMGGHANGQDASRLAIQTMIDFMLPRISSSTTQLDEAGLRQLLAEGVQSANQAVHNRNMESRADMGTTMTTALVVGPIAYVANVGDSRTYLHRDGVGLVKVTNDHSVVASLVEAGIIKPDDIYTHPKRNQIYRSLGEKSMVEVDTFKVDLKAGDKLLLCSDGLWDMVRDPTIEQVLNRPVNDPNMTSKELINAALESGGEDNVSVIVAQFVETNEHTGQTGMHLLAKPETVTVPNLPPI